MGVGLVLDELHYPVLVSHWKDQSGNDRVHVVYNLPSGMLKSDIHNPRVEGGEFIMDLIWATDMFSIARVLGHQKFNPIFTSDHPKWIALSSAMREIRGTNQNRNTSYRSHVRVGLPGVGFCL